MEANGSSTQSEVDVARMPQMGMFVLERMPQKLWEIMAIVIGHLQGNLQQSPKRDATSKRIKAPPSGGIFFPPGPWLPWKSPRPKSRRLPPRCPCDVVANQREDNARDS